MKRKEKKELKCYACKNKATHVIMMELRDRPGPPLKDNDVLYTACDIHSVETSFDYYVPYSAFVHICNNWKKKAGIYLNKRFCTINILKFR